MKRITLLLLIIFPLIASTCGNDPDPQPKEEVFNIDIQNSSDDYLFIAVANITSQDLVEPDDLFDSIPPLGIRTYKVREGDSIFVKTQLYARGDKYMIGGMDGWYHSYESDTTLVMKGRGNYYYQYFVPGSEVQGLQIINGVSKPIEVEIHWDENGKHEWGTIAELNPGEPGGLEKTIGFLETSELEKMNNAYLEAMYRDDNDNYKERRSKIPLWTNPPKVDDVYLDQTVYIMRQIPNF